MRSAKAAVWSQFMLGITHAPELDRKGLTWFNVNGPLSLSDLAGRLLILDFWTSCSVNCLHTLPILRKIEELFPEEAVVIGVHSPKFTAERDPKNLAHAIARHAISHPVIHDPDLTLWKEYAVSAWPTLIFISPDGKIVGNLPGEPDEKKFCAGVSKMIHEWRRDHALSPAPLTLSIRQASSGSLRFPGKIKPLRGGAGEKLWAVADAGHHQIAVFDGQGQETARYGSGRPGFIDANPLQSAFNGPQGLVCRGQTIFVADTGNHAIRRIDLVSGEVETLAGTGARGRSLPLRRSLNGVGVDLASVWDLEISGTRLFFANAGSHQIGELDLRSGRVACLAGSGAESLMDGPADHAQLAQPSGLALGPDGNTLYFADAETSAVRKISLRPPVSVTTLVGTGVFDFGAKNGPFTDSRLQHPLGLTRAANGLVVADSYNGRLRYFDLKNRLVRDVGEGAFNCEDARPVALSEPAAVAADGLDRFLVSDTSNHRIFEVDVTGRKTRTWAA